MKSFCTFENAYCVGINMFIDVIIYEIFKLLVTSAIVLSKTEYEYRPKVKPPQSMAVF